MEPPNPTSLRVLIRPSNTSSSTPSISSSSPSLNPPLQTIPSATLPPPPPPPEGVVVVGFVGGDPDETAHLINCIIDSNAFGSGRLGRELCPHSRGVEDARVRKRRIRYYHDEERGMVFSQFCSPRSLRRLEEGVSMMGSGCGGLGDVLEEGEAEDLKEMLVMFTVCHVIVFLHEGSRFDTQSLKKFRILQAAKHAFFPFVKSHITPLSMSKALSSHSQISAPVTTSISPGRGGGSMSRHASAISLMSGSGSYPSMFPGQCAPVMLFVFRDDFLDGPSSGASTEDLMDASSLNPSTSSSATLRLSASKISPVPARPSSKTEGLKKKLQSSLDAQIRFLIKKCRTLAGAEGTHAGSRGLGNTSSLPLFSLDTSRAVMLLDRSMSHGGESLEYITSLVEEVLNLKGGLDVSVLENHCQNGNNEDIQSIKDFIFRQSDSLRGRAGSPASTNSGSAAGVGMLAVAAAAAAASAAAGKQLSTPELPSFETWLSLSHLIYDVLLPVRGGSVYDDGSGGITYLQGDDVTNHDAVGRLGKNSIEAVVARLEGCRGLDKKFSTSWCQRTLPVAKDVYMKDLPACYPTALHKAQLEKALHAFSSMVKGPSVHLFMEKLEEECTSIWKSGRQLCDAVSLTGKPCIHQRRHTETSDLPESDIKPHSSGFVFLHACACGRSRRLRDDPFDFDSANITFSCFPNCENLLSALQLPKASNGGHLSTSSWSLIRLGGARYYEPSKGLLQSGFCTTEKFLLRWTIMLEKQNGANGSPACLTHRRPSMKPISHPKLELAVDKEAKRDDDAQLSFSKEVQIEEIQEQKRSSVDIYTDEPKINFGRGLPSFSLKKPFSDVVAGLSVSDSMFPPLQPKKQVCIGLEKRIKQKDEQKPTNHQIHANSRQVLQKSGDVVVEGFANSSATSCYAEGDPVLQIGSNVVPVNINNVGWKKPVTSSEQFIACVGFEHECPYGHRFLLSASHLKDLGLPYSLEEHDYSSNGSSDRISAESLLPKNYSMHDKVHPHSNGRSAGTMYKDMKMKKLKETPANGIQQDYTDNFFSRSEKDSYKSSHMHPHHAQFEEGNEENFHYMTTLDDGWHAHSLLNRNLPIYMNCPYCRNSENKSHQKMKFASTVSQLQRIFVVTPPFPVVLASCPVVQFESACLPPSVSGSEQQLQFSLGCRVILPPESFLTLKLPFVYGVKLADRSIHPLNYLDNRPELTAWITKGTTLQIVS